MKKKELLNVRCVIIILWLGKIYMNEAKQQMNLEEEAK